MPTPINVANREDQLVIKQMVEDLNVTIEDSGGAITTADGKSYRPILDEVFAGYGNVLHVDKNSEFRGDSSFVSNDGKYIYSFKTNSFSILKYDPDNSFPQLKSFPLPTGFAFVSPTVVGGFIPFVEDDEHIYLLTYDTSNVASMKVNIVKKETWTAVGTSLSSLAPAIVSCRGIFIDESNIYFISGASSHRIYKMPPATLKAITLTNNSSIVSNSLLVPNSDLGVNYIGTIIDEDFIYHFGGVSGSSIIKKLNKTSGDIVSSQNNTASNFPNSSDIKGYPFFVYQTDTHIYFNYQGSNMYIFSKDTLAYNIINFNGFGTNAYLQNFHKINDYDFVAVMRNPSTTTSPPYYTLEFLLVKIKPSGYEFEYKVADLITKIRLTGTTASTMASILVNGQLRDTIISSPSNHFNPLSAKFARKISGYEEVIPDVTPNP